MASAPTFVGTPKLKLAQATSASTASTGTALTKIQISAPSVAEKIVGISCSNSDSTAHDVVLVLTRSAVDYILCRTTVAGNSGFANATPALNLLANTYGLPIDTEGNPYLFLESGDTLSFAYFTAVTATAGMALSVIANAGDF